MAKVNGSYLLELEKIYRKYTRIREIQVVNKFLKWIYSIET